MKKSDLFFNVLRLPVDFLMLSAAGLVTYFFRTEILSAFRPVLFEFNLPLLNYFYLVVFVSFLFLAIFAVSGLYSMKARMGVAEEFFKILIASSAGVMIVIIYIFLRQELFNSRFLVLGGWWFAVVFVSLGRLAVRFLQAFVVLKYNFGAHKLMIIGDDKIAATITSEIEKDPSSGYRIVKHLLNPEVGEIQMTIGNPGVDEVILTNSRYPHSKIAELIDFCQEKHIIFKFMPTFSALMTNNFDIDVFKGLPFIEIKMTALEGWGKVLKRLIDISVGAIGLILFSPIFAAAAFAIKWETEGPVFVCLKRISGSREFYLYKFRSMIENAEELKLHLIAFNERLDGPLFKVRNDPRITKVGRILRKFRIDELPQFWNILKGEISLVGPRPHQPDEVEKYKRHHRKVLAIKAGATGLAQISGSSDLDFEQEVALDSFYIDSWSLWLDMKIILKTLLKIFIDKSAV